MPSYRIALGSRLIIEEGTAQSPNYSGLTFEVSGISYPTLGAAVNASATEVTNLFSGTAYTDNRAQVFQGPTVFDQPITIAPASSSTQAASLSQVVSYTNLSGFGTEVATLQSNQSGIQNTISVLQSSGGNISSELSGVQTLAVSTQNQATVLTGNFSGLQNELLPLQLEVVTLSNNQSGIQAIVVFTQYEGNVLGNNYSGLSATELNSQTRLSVLTSNYSGLQVEASSVQAEASILGRNFSGLNNTVVYLQDNSGGGGPPFILAANTTLAESGGGEIIGADSNNNAILKCGDDGIEVPAIGFSNAYLPTFWLGYPDGASAQIAGFYGQAFGSATAQASDVTIVSYTPSTTTIVRVDCFLNQIVTGSGNYSIQVFWTDENDQAQGMALWVIQSSGGASQSPTTAVLGPALVSSVILAVTVDSTVTLSTNGQQGEFDVYGVITDLGLSF
jgi:hypothetical protein